MGKKYYFRVCYIDPWQGAAAATYVYNNLGFKKAGILMDMTNDYAVGLASFFKRSFKKLGGEIVADLKYSSGDQDFTAQLTELIKQKPDVVFMPAYFAEGAIIMKQARELGATFRLMGADAMDNPDTVKLGGKAVEGFLHTTFPYDAKMPNMSAEAKKFTEVWYAANPGKDPNVNAALGYNAYYLILDAITRANSDKPQAITEALAKTKNLSTPLGSLSINATHDAEMPVGIIEYRNGQRVYLTNALTLGSLYALIAIGYTMVYGVLRLINFAHGDILMVGAYFVFFGTFAFGWPWGVSAIVAVCGASLLGVLVERVAYRPLREAPRISALISAIAVSFFIESLAVVVFTGQPRPVLQPDWLISEWQWGNIRILKLTAFVPVMTAVLVAGLLYILYRTKPGLAMRAISKDIETTRLMGVRVDNIIAFTFAVGSALAAASGIMWALRYPQVHPYMGIMPGLKAFVAAVVGGIGSVQGAVIGGVILGFVEIMSIAFFPEMSGYRDAFAFIILVLVLVFKPTGLLGENLKEKI